MEKNEKNLLNRTITQKKVVCRRLFSSVFFFVSRISYMFKSNQFRARWIEKKNVYVYKRASRDENKRQKKNVIVIKMNCVLYNKKIYQLFGRK